MKSWISNVSRSLRRLAREGALSVALLSAHGASGPAPSPAAPTTARQQAVAWPDTREGELARGWVEAFDAGEPAMRKFLAESLSPSSLAAKGVEARIETYRQMREQLGTLRLARVHEERPDALDVALTDAEGREHDFTFEIEAEEPRSLKGVTARLRVGHGH